MKFRSLQFSIIWIFSYHIRTAQMVLARTNIHLQDHKTIWESRKLHSKAFCYFFSLGVPVATGDVQYKSLIITCKQNSCLNKQIKLGNVKISCFRIQSAKGMGMEIHDYLHYIHNYTHEIYLTEHLHSVHFFSVFRLPERGSFAYRFLLKEALSRL